MNLLTISLLLVASLRTCIKKEIYGRYKVQWSLYLRTKDSKSRGMIYSKRKYVIPWIPMQAQNLSHDKMKTFLLSTLRTI